MAKASKNQGQVKNQTAIIYCRVSTQKQVNEGISLDMQIARCSEYATSKGLTVKDVIVDAGISAKDTLHRPGMTRLLDMAKRGEIANIVAFKMDRLFRNVVDTNQNVSLLTKKGVEIHLVADNDTVKVESANDELQFGIKALLSVHERKQISERTKQALARKRERGEFCGGEAPYGHSNANGNLIPNLLEQAVISKIRNLRNKGYSLRKIAACLAQDGCFNRKGKLFHQNQIQQILEKAA